MTYSQFTETIRRTGSYRTPDNVRIPLLSRLLGRFDGWFYALLMWVVARASTRASLGRYSYPHWGESSFRTLRAIEKCGGRVSVTGLEKVFSLDGPAVFVCNHMSMIETFLTPCLLVHWRPFANVVKQSLLTYPVFGPVMRWTRPVAVTRQNPREDLKTVMEEGMARIRDGISMVIYPQATRSLTFDSARFNTLGVKLARRAGVPVVPVAVQSDFLGIGKRLRDFGAIDRSRPVRFVFGGPIEIGGDEKGAHRAVVDFITANLAEWGVPVERGEPRGADREKEES